MSIVATTEPAAEAAIVAACREFHLPTVRAEAPPWPTPLTTTQRHRSSHHGQRLSPVGSYCTAP